MQTIIEHPETRDLYRPNLRFSDKDIDKALEKIRAGKLVQIKINRRRYAHFRS